MKNTSAVLLLAAMAVGLSLAFAPAIAGTEEDVARIERKFEIRKLAREIFDRADKRAAEAARNSPTIQKNNEDMLGEMDKCFAISNQRIETIERGQMSADEATRLLDSCLQSALERNPNGEIIEKLRDEFIEEELDILRESIEEPKRKELRKEVQKLTI